MADRIRKLPPAQKKNLHTDVHIDSWLFINEEADSEGLSQGWAIDKIIREIKRLRNAAIDGYGKPPSRAV